MGILIQHMLFALTTNVVGVGLLFYSWRQRQLSTKQASTTFNVTGVCFVLLAWYFWCSCAGVEFGTVYWLITTPLVAWVWVVWNRQEKPVVFKSKPHMFTPIPFRQLVHGSGTLLVAGPLAFMASGVLSLVLVSGFPMSGPMLESGQLVLAVFLLVIIWSLFCFWACAAEKLLRPFVSLTGLAVVGGWILWV